jgi:hypothetical protein
LQTVSAKTGLQCKGACKRWAHFTCLQYSPAKIADIKAGVITITCPCPTCNTIEAKDFVANTTVKYKKGERPANQKTICGNDLCPSNKASPIPESKKTDETQNASHDTANAPDIDKTPKPDDAPTAKTEAPDASKDPNASNAANPTTPPDTAKAPDTPNATNATKTSTVKSAKGPSVRRWSKKGKQDTTNAPKTANALKTDIAPNTTNAQNIANPPTTPDSPNTVSTPNAANPPNTNAANYPNSANAACGPACAEIKEVQSKDPDAPEPDKCPDGCEPVKTLDDVDREPQSKPLPPATVKTILPPTEGPVTPVKQSPITSDQKCDDPLSDQTNCADKINTLEKKERKCKEEEDDCEVVHKKCNDTNNTRFKLSKKGKGVKRSDSVGTVYKPRRDVSDDCQRDSFESFDRERLNKHLRQRNIALRRGSSCSCISAEGLFFLHYCMYIR